MNKNDFIEFVLSARPVKRSTAAQHYYTLQRLRRVTEQRPSSVIPCEAEWITQLLLKKLNTLSNTTQKNMYSSLLVYLKGLKAEHMINNISGLLEKTAKIQENAYLSQELSAKQRLNWVDFACIKTFFLETQQTVKAQQIFKREELSWSARDLLQQYVIQAIHGGILAPPRLEWAKMRFFTAKSNALAYAGNSIFFKPQCHINIIHGKVQKGLLKLPKKMVTLMKKYCFFLKEGDFLFISKKGAPLTTNSYGKRLKQIFYERFQKNIGCQLLRNIYITKSYETVPALKEMKKTSNAMMHSLDTALMYYKKNPPELK